MNDLLFETKSSGIPAIPVSPPKSIITYSSKVTIALPWMKIVSPLTAFSVAQLMDKRRTASMLSWGDSFVAHSRNHCVDEFLKTDSEWLAMFDDDMVFPFGNAKWYRAFTGWEWYPEPFASFNAIDRLMSHKKSVVGGLYFGRHESGPPVTAIGASNSKAAEYMRKGPHDEIMSTGWVGTGAILIHRQVFEDIEKKFPQLARGPNGEGIQVFTSSEHELLDGIKRVHSMLSEGVMDSMKAMRAYEMIDGLLTKTRHTSPHGVGEDVIFGRRATQAGHEVFVDLGLVCGHIGHKIFGPRNTAPKKIA